MDKKYYVLGFLFSPDCKRVALIIKNRPDWQAGFLNGIGGKIDSRFQSSGIFTNYTGVGPCRFCPE